MNLTNDRASNREIKMNRIKFTTGVVAAAAMTAAVLVAPATAQAQYFKGKTITMLIPVPGGSGLDLLARTFAEHMARHIPGQPTIVARNMPGGGGVKSMNFLFDKGGPDGLTINYGPWNAGGVVAKAPGIRFDPQKLAYIGSSHIPQTTILRTDAGAGLKTSADILKAGNFKLGGRGPTQSLDMVGNLALDIIGAKYTYVPGYRGMAKIRPAIMTGEVMGGHSGYIGYNRFFRDTLIKEGKALALWYHSSFDDGGQPVNNPVVTEFQSFHDVYKQVHGKLPSGPKWETYRWVRTNESQMAQSIFAGRGTPPNIVSDLRKGFYGVENDAGYAAVIKKLTGTKVTFTPAEQGLAALKSFRDVPPGMKSVLEEMSKKGQ